MPKLFLRAVLAREEVADKQCLHAVQELFNVRAQPVIGTIVRPSKDKLQRPGGNHYETICQEGCNALFAGAVESPACGFPEEPALALSGGNAINHRSALSPQNRGLKLKLQAESSAGKQVHRHTKRKKKHTGGQGREVCSPSVRRSLSVSGNQMKRGIAFACHGLICIDGLFSSNWVPTDETEILPRPTSPEVRMAPCAKYQAGLTRSDVRSLLIFTCYMYWGLQARPGSERVNLRSFRWRQRDKQAAFLNGAAKWYTRHWGINGSSLVQRDPWGERIKVKCGPKGLSNPQVALQILNRDGVCLTGLWIRWEFHYMDMLKDDLTIRSYLVCIKHFCYSGSPKQILCLTVLNSSKGRNISCRSGLSFHFEITETAMRVSLAKFLGLPCWWCSNQSKWIRSKMSKYISIQLITILQSCLRAKKIHSPVLNQDITTTKCSKLNTSKNCLTHVSHLILYL